MANNHGEVRPALRSIQKFRKWNSRKNFAEPKIVRLLPDYNDHANGNKSYYM
jgi:hypothetical protein